MKKRKLNAADLMLILILVLCAAGIVIRAFRLPLLPSVSEKDYRIAFTAETDREQLDSISAGTEFKDGGGTGSMLMEGYWIKENDGVFTLNGELLMKGRITESGFESGGKYYHKGDSLTLTHKNGTITAVITDFLEKR